MQLTCTLRARNPCFLPQKDRRAGTCASERVISWTIYEISATMMRHSICIGRGVADLFSVLGVLLAVSWAWNSGPRAAHVRLQCNEIIHVKGFVEAALAGRNPGPRRPPHDERVLRG